MALKSGRWLGCCMGQARQCPETLGACRGDICTQKMQHLALAADGLAWVLPVTPGRRDQLPGSAQIWVWAGTARGMLRRTRRRLLAQSSWQPDHGRRC